MPKVKNQVPKECRFCGFYNSIECQLCRNHSMFSFDKTRFIFCDKCGKIAGKDDAVRVLVKNHGKIQLKYYCWNCKTGLTHSDYTGKDWDGDRSSMAIYSDFGRTPRRVVNHELAFLKNRIGKIYKCDKCGNYFTSDQKNPAYRICKACSTRMRNGYGYKPEPAFFGNDKKIRYGIELETEGAGCRNDELAILLSREVPEVYCKEDGSLANRGCEVVSHPADLGTLQKVYKKVCHIAGGLGCTSWESGHCGLHIHINRADLEKTDFSIRGITTGDNRVKWEYAITYFFEKFRECWERIAGRSGNDYAEFITSHCPATLQNVTRFISHSNRYRAVNLCNTNTIELRMFRGTINYRSISTIFWAVDSFINKLVKVHNFEKLDNLTFREFFPGKLPSFVKNSRVKSLFIPGAVIIPESELYSDDEEEEL